MKKRKTFSNELSKAEAERLALLSEELGEAQQAIGKILRHGYESTNPVLTLPNPTNRESLEREIGDVVAALALMGAADDLNFKNVREHEQRKLKKVGQYLHHQKAEYLQTALNFMTR